MGSAYHHGNLRAAVVAEAVRVIGERGVGAVSIRALAANLGVSHTAPLHHFGSLRGVFTAIAVDGFSQLDSALTATRSREGGFLDQGVAYVEFALAHPAHFAVMFDTTLLDPDDASLIDARRRAFSHLEVGVSTLADPSHAADAAAAVVAGWALVHGIATLALTGNLAASGLPAYLDTDDVAELTRRSAGMLYGSPTARVGDQP